MIQALAVLVALLCSVASARRMWLVSNATAWHPAPLLAAVGKKPDRAVVARLAATAKDDPKADWERDFFAALDEPDERKRAALVNEQLTELDYRIHRWANVPPMCARIATSFAFLLAALVMRHGLSDATDFSEAAMGALVSDGLTVVFLGFVGTTFCITANRHARAVARARLEAADALVEKLEALAPTLPG